MRYLRHALTLFALAALPVSLIVAATSTSNTAPKKKTTSKKRKSATSSTRTRTGTSTRSRTTASRAPVRTRQTQPTPERYKEIQQALASKGYLNGEPTGAWDPQSADAMRRFQLDQNINPSGKIDSLSLIALGLGPKRGTNAAPPAPPSSPAPPEPKPETQPPPVAN